MPEDNNFIQDVQGAHLELLDLLTSFQGEIEKFHLHEAKEILADINKRLIGHFSFEETYLYPRLRRLVAEIITNLSNEQQAMKEFLLKSTELLQKNKLNKNEISSILDRIPKLCKLLKDCNSFVFLAGRFCEEEKADLSQRFRDCCGVKDTVAVYSTSHNQWK